MAVGSVAVGSAAVGSAAVADPRAGSAGCTAAGRAAPVIGLDGCPGGGWAAAVVTAERVRLTTLPDLAAALAYRTTGAPGSAGDPPCAIGVDIPIGLPTSQPRAADRAARALLGPARSSVFPAPPRAVLGATDYRDACRRAQAATGRMISLQAWHLVPRIAAVDRELAASDAPVVTEVHPEVSFRVLVAQLTGTDAPAVRLPSKKTLAGRDARRAALLAAWPDRDTTDLAQLRAKGPARPDDLLDAAVAAWSAQRWAAGVAVLLPALDDRDATGRRMQIVA